MTDVLLVDVAFRSRGGGNAAEGHEGSHREAVAEGHEKSDEACEGRLLKPEHTLTCHQTCHIVVFCSVDCIDITLFTNYVGQAPAAMKKNKARRAATTRARPTKACLGPNITSCHIRKHLTERISFKLVVDRVWRKLP